MKYFEYLPSVEYSGISATNIMVRAKVREFVLENAAVYYKYVVRDGERPDSLASMYYGNANHTWLIFYANDIYDPIFDWPLSTEALVNQLIFKYGSVEYAKSTPHHYLLEGKYIIDRLTYIDTNLPQNQKSIITIYEHEHLLNEKKRDILLIDQVYVQQIINEMRRLF